MGVPTGNRGRVVARVKQGVVEGSNRSDEKGREEGRRFGSNKVININQET